MSGKQPYDDFRQVIIKALQQLNIEKAAQHSRLDHHTVGLDYLNLQRSDKFTLKLYLLAPNTNNNSGFLVHPHTHRYEFNTVVLAGRVENVVFVDPGNKSIPGDLLNFPMVRHEYSPEGISGKPKGTWLCHQIDDSGVYNAGEAYYLKTDQIHTLRTSKWPTLLCLSQFADLAEKSSLYLPPGYELGAPTGRIPTVSEAEVLRQRCLDLLQ